MSRAAIAVCCAALLASLAGAGHVSADAPDRGRPLLRLAGQSSAAQPCVVWKKHQKRVVKRVRRNGEWKRVVRVKRWRSCARRAAPAVPPVVAPPPPEPDPQPEPEYPGIPRLGVKAEDSEAFRYTLTRDSVPAGEVVVELNNQGEDPHNLNLELADASGPELSLPTVGPGAQSKGKFDLPAGEYRLWCSLDGHEAAGMSATLLVVP